jgi:RNA polymerase sigma-70 factor (ECF subfamily)
MSDGLTQKNPNSLFESLEKNPTYVTIVHLMREANAQDPDILKVLEHFEITGIRKEGIQQRGASKFGSREAYQVALKEKYEALGASLPPGIAEYVDLYMRAERPNKYWQGERTTRAAVAHMLRQGTSLKIISYVISFYFESTLTSKNIREALKPIGSDELIRRLELSLTEDEKLMGVCLVDQLSGKAQTHRSEKARYKNEVTRDKKYRLLILTLHTSGLSAQGIVYAFTRHTNVRPSENTIKKFLEHTHTLPTVDTADTTWVEQISAVAKTEYQAAKTERYRAGVHKRLPHTEQRLCAQYYRPLLGFARTISSNLAEELTHVTLTKLVLSLRRGFKPWEHSGLLPWLKVVCRNSHIDIVRKKEPFLMTSTDEGKDILESIADVSADNNPELLADNSKRQLAILNALKALPQEQQEVARLHFYEDLSHAEIAAQLNTPLGTVKSRLRLASEKLRTHLKDFNDFKD